MKIPQNLSTINSTVFLLEMDQESGDKVNFTWNLIDFNDNIMKI